MICDDKYLFSYSGIFAFKKETIRKNSVNFYFNCYSLNNRLDIYGFFFDGKLVGGSSEPTEPFVLDHGIKNPRGGGEIRR